MQSGTVEPVLRAGVRIARDVHHGLGDLFGGEDRLEAVDEGLAADPRRAAYASTAPEPSAVAGVS